MEEGFQFIFRLPHWGLGSLRSRLQHLPYPPHCQAVSAGRRSCAYCFSGRIAVLCRLFRGFQGIPFCLFPCKELLCFLIRPESRMLTERFSMRILRSFEIRTVHPKPQEPCAECILLILIVDILCLDAFLADRLVHQIGKVTGKPSDDHSRKPSGIPEGNLFFCDHQTFHRSSALCFVTFKRLDEVCHRVGATRRSHSVSIRSVSTWKCPPVALLMSRPRL